MQPAFETETHEQQLKLSLTYLIYARCFYGQVDVIKAMVDTGEATGEVDEDVRHLLHQLRETPEEELTLQYENLFFIPGPYYVPPYVSVYLDDEEANGSTVHQLSGYYARFDFLDYARTTNLRHDHIGTVLMFAHYLIQMQLEQHEDAEDAKKMYQILLHEVIRPMYGVFEKKVSDQLVKGFYLDLVQGAHRFLSETSEIIEKD